MSPKVGSLSLDLQELAGLAMSLACSIRAVSRVSPALQVEDVSRYYCFMRRGEGSRGSRDHRAGLWVLGGDPVCGSLLTPVQAWAHAVTSPSLLSRLASFCVKWLNNLSSEAMSVFRLRTLGCSFNQRSEALEPNTGRGAGCSPSLVASRSHTSHISRVQWHTCPVATILDGVDARRMCPASPGSPGKCCSGLYTAGLVRR